MPVTFETATVYRTSSGKRYFTKRAAFKHEALSRLRRKERHEMQGVYDELRGGDHYQEEFYTEEQMNLFSKIEARYWRRFRQFISGGKQA